MITRTFDEGPWKGLTTLDLALTPKEIDLLREIAVEMDGNDWEDGRQGTGYFKLNLMDIYAGGDSLLGAVRSRLLNAIKRRLGLPDGLKLQRRNDFWLLYYPEGSSVPWHVDPAPPGAKHWRANVCVTAPKEGGAFVVRNGYFVEANLPVNLAESEGILFCASDREHAVGHVLKGYRLVVSVGAIIDD